MPGGGWKSAGLGMSVGELRAWATNLDPAVPFNIDALDEGDQKQVLAAFYDVATNCPTLSLPAGGVWAFDTNEYPGVTRYSIGNPIENNRDQVQIAVGQHQEFNPSVLRGEIERVTKVRDSAAKWGDAAYIEAADKKLTYLSNMLKTVSKRPGSEEKAQHMAGVVPFGQVLYATTLHELGHHWHMAKHATDLPDLTDGPSALITTNWTPKGNAWKAANLQKLSARSEDRIDEMWAESFLARAIGQGQRVPADVRKFMDEDGLWLP